MLDSDFSVDGDFIVTFLPLVTFLFARAAHIYDVRKRSSSSDNLSHVVAFLIS